MRRFALLAVLLLLLPSRAHAQDDDDSTRIVNVSPAVGFHYGQPLRLSIAAGGLFDLNGGRNDGIVAMAEMGQGGGELSIGYFQFLRFGRGRTCGSRRCAPRRTRGMPRRARRTSASRRT